MPTSLLTRIVAALPARCACSRRSTAWRAVASAPGRRAPLSHRDPGGSAARQPEGHAIDEHHGNIGVGRFDCRPRIARLLQRAPGGRADGTMGRLCAPPSPRPAAARWQHRAPYLAHRQWRLPGVPRGCSSRCGRLRGSGRAWGHHHSRLERQRKQRQHFVHLGNRAVAIAGKAVNLAHDSAPEQPGRAAADKPGQEAY